MTTRACIFVLMMAFWVTGGQANENQLPAVETPPVEITEIAPIEIEPYRVGRAMTDVTGPAYGIQMWGFGREDQLTEGLHIRQRARAFIIAEPDPLTGKRIVFVSVDIGSIEHNIVLEVLDRLAAKFGTLYTLDNVVLSATHTHAGAGGYWHTRAELGLAGGFYPEHYNHIVDGIVRSIEQAHADLAPATIFINKGEVLGAGANRSLIAYEQNPEEERARYGSPLDQEMTLLRVNRDEVAVGLINWFATHPTSMTYNNHLISGDHKGYASLTFETAEGTTYTEADDFVAAFAQSTPGDVTPNLNLNNTGPGADEFESTAIIGTRQMDVARTLFETATEPLAGAIKHRQVYVDLSHYQVDAAFTGGQSETTCPSAYGYSFAGGSTEDGGGHFLFSEGMTEQKFYLDFLISWLTGAPDWTPEVKACQGEKAILFETGTGNPPLQSQIRSVSLIQIGQLAILAMPTEITTMSARRLKESLKAVLGDETDHIVIAGYANDYAGYVTTPEEYSIQQYEGGHTLHGKWTLPAYQQIVTRLAQSMKPGGATLETVAYDDWRGRSVERPLHDGTADALPEGSTFGEVISMGDAAFNRGDLVKLTFRSGNPSANYGRIPSFLAIEREVEGSWVRVTGDEAWSTKIHWTEGDIENGLLAEISWQTAGDTPTGSYRIRHSGVTTSGRGVAQGFEAVSPPFALNE
ncbi:MAG: neutral/alkaline non-lysosomal ceramidase N-terminal domain-containing protein [Parvibaculum sp.]